MPQIRKVDSQDNSATVKTITRTVEQIAVPPPGPEPEAKQDIAEWWAGLQPGDWPLYAFYLWRLDSNVEITDPRVSNPGWRGGKYLHRFTVEDLREFEGQDFMGALSDWVKQRFGGSMYKLLVTQRKTSTAIHAKVFTVEGEARLSDRESYRPGMGLVGGDQKTGVENIVLAFLKEQLETAKAKALDPSAAVETAIGMMSKANDRALEMALKQVPPQSNPMDQLSAMIGAIEKMGLFKRENESEKLLRELIAEMRGKEEKRSVWDEVRAAKEGMALLGVGRGSAADAGWVDVARILAPSLEKIADKAFAAMSRRPAPAAPPAHGTPNGPLMVLPPPTVPVSQNPAPSAAQPPAPPAQENQEAFAREVVTNYIFGKIRERFDAGHEGDAVAEWLDQTERPLANQLGYLSAAQLVNLMNQNPLFAPVGAHPRMPQFVKDFLAYFSEEESKPA